MQQKHGSAPAAIGDISLHDSAILLDVDGTIVDLAPTPRDVVVAPRLKKALKTLSQRTNGAVAFVSGRPLGDLDRLFAPLKLAAGGGPRAQNRGGRRCQARRYGGPLRGALGRPFPGVW